MEWKCSDCNSCENLNYVAFISCKVVVICHSGALAEKTSTDDNDNNMRRVQVHPTMDLLSVEKSLERERDRVKVCAEQRHR